MDNGENGVNGYAPEDVEEESNTKRKDAEIQHLNMEDFSVKEMEF